MTLRRNFPALRSLSAFVVLALASRSGPARACAFFDPTLFVSRYGPDVPAAKFAAGELGVLQPTWIRANLVLAYLELANVPLPDADRSAAVAYLEGPKPPGTEGYEAWQAARQAATGAPGPAIETERSVGYSTYVNCGDDAFRSAAATLGRYVAAHGRESSETRGWLAAQDVVFGNCGGKEPVAPEPLPSSAPASLRVDRAYQIASARFYGGRLEDAQKDFEAIASDTDSRWKSLAAYLAGRSVLRRATLDTEDPAAFRALVTEARRRFAGLAASSPDPKVRLASSDLVRFADLRLDPAARIPETAARLLRPVPDGEFGPVFVHYRDLLFRVLGFSLDPGDYVPDPKDDLTSWIVAFQDPTPRGLDRALAGFSRAPSPAWIAAVLSKISASHPRAPEVVEAARRLPPGGPGRVHVAYHLARLATESGRIPEARALVAANLAAAEAAGASATNLFLELKARNAASFEEFASAAPRRALSPEWVDAEELHFDDFARDVVNRRLPLDALLRFLRTAKLGPKAAEDARRIVFTRAVLLGRADVARAAAPSGARIRWDAPDWRVDAILSVLVEDSASRPYADLDPPFSIAWWCPLPGPLVEGADPAFLSVEERRAAEAEVARLAAGPSAATWFCRQAIAFAKEKPDDPRAPELLARAVRTTREGCGDAETESLSKAAFRLLHGRWPKSSWAKETKYWFSGRGYVPSPRPPS
jgi:hypothetical protein